jgi:hypothetical protein
MPSGRNRDCSMPWEYYRTVADDNLEILKAFHGGEIIGV